MRNYISIIILTMLCMLASCKTSQLHSVAGAEPQRPLQTEQEQQRPPLAGGYTEYRELTEEDVRLFQTTYSGELELRPIRVATCIVAGRNYKFVCVDSDEHEVIVIIHHPLPGRGEPRVLSITKFHYPKL